VPKPELQLTQDFAARGVFSGVETARGGAAHDGVGAFDWDRWGEDVRNDWLDTSFNGTVDGRAQASTSWSGRPTTSTARRMVLRTR
jgi:hypothetical protein